MKTVVGGSLWILSTTDKVGLWIEGRHEALAMPIEVVLDEVLVNGTRVSQDTVPSSVSTRVNLGYHENT